MDITCVVWGKVDGNYWKILMACDEVFNVTIMLDSDFDTERYECKPYLLMETEIRRTNISETAINL